MIFKIFIDKRNISKCLKKTKTHWFHLLENGSKNHPKMFSAKIETKFNYFPMFKVFILFLMRGHIGFSVGIDSTKVCLSEIIYTFSRPLGRRRKNRAKYHPKMILAKFGIEFCQNLFLNPLLPNHSIWHRFKLLRL